MVGDEPGRPRAAEVHAWLRTAVDRHQRGELVAAQKLYEQILASEPAHADALQYFGILCQQRGDTDRAEQLIRQAIAVRPDVAPFHDNLGTVLEQAGRFDEALSAYQQAERLEPGVVERAGNVGLVLERLGRQAEAERHYREAIERHAHDMHSRLALARLLSKGNDLQVAVTAFREILALNANDIAARIGLGNVLQDDGQLDAALAEYRAVISRHPDNAEAWHNQGRALANAQRFAQAQHSFEQALQFDPQLLEARLGLARMLERLGLFERAYASFRELCVTPSADGDLVTRARAGVLRVARVLPISKYDDVLVATLLSAIESGEIDAVQFMHAIGNQLAAKAGLMQGESTDDADALRRAVALQSDPLFRVALEQSANVVPVVERWLCAARRALLHASSEELKGREPLLYALAMQGFANEYVFAVSDDEVGVIDAVLAQLEPQTASGLIAFDDNVCDLLLCACYGPLNELWGAQALAELDPETLGPWLTPIVQRTVIEPAQERARAVEVEELAPIADTSSQLVRAQYEENPYPRWRELPPVATLADVFSIDSISEAIASEPQAPFLVAGCGTGFEPLLLARQFPERTIVALDLSRTSLGYASRMAAQHGIVNVRFVHGDLFDVGRLGFRFSMIAASGVLHHLADPLAGWRVLAEQLVGNGVMKVALYSRRARTVINAARERIAELGLAADTRGVRALRARVLAGQEAGLASLLDSEDFYTTSMCRDLIFHPLEHQFDLRKISSMLDALGLRFEGFELPHPLIRQQFLAAQLGEETDLQAWDRFEEHNPRTFDGMYVMWCRKSCSVTGDKGAS